MDSKLLCFILVTATAFDVSKCAFTFGTLDPATTTGKTTGAIWSRNNNENEAYKYSPTSSLFFYSENQHAEPTGSQGSYKNGVGIIAKYNRPHGGENAIRHKGKYGSNIAHDGYDDDHNGGDRSGGYKHRYNYGYHHGHDYHHHRAHDGDGHSGNDDHDYHHVNQDYDNGGDADHNSGENDYGYNECDYQHGPACQRGSGHQDATGTRYHGGTGSNGDGVNRGYEGYEYGYGQNHLQIGGHHFPGTDRDHGDDYYGRHGGNSYHGEDYHRG